MSENQWGDKSLCSRFNNITQHSTTVTKSRLKKIIKENTLLTDVLKRKHSIMQTGL